MYDISKPEEVNIQASEVLAYIEKELVHFSHRLGFRGQRCADWQLSPSLTRFLLRLKEKNKIENSVSYDTIQQRILEEFKKNILINQDLTPEQLTLVDLWAYGQHHGLPTPLLDWTYSAYVGLFFALNEGTINETNGITQSRCLWVMDLDLLSHINTLIRETIWPKMKDKIKPEEAMKRQIPTMNLIGDINGYNRRIVYQQGFFTKHVYYESFEIWAERIASEVSHECWNYPLLRKITFSATENEISKMLITLDKMNVNSRTLFPDIYGSVAQTCFAIEHRQNKGLISFSGSTRK